jgi:DNA primase catalytic core
MRSLDWKVRQDYYSASRIFLCQDEEGRPGREYLLKERGLDWDTIGKFRLGYLPFSTDVSFAGRIIMPIFDLYDDLLALSARPATSDEEVLKDVGKYWNESFHKREHLYGLNLAKHSIGRSNYVIVVEGQMDVLAMHSYGFYNTVGILGGAFTHIHGMLLKRFCQNIIVMMDGDKAGQNHAIKFREPLEQLCPRGGDVKWAVVSLNGDQKDPDLFLRAHGSEKLHGLIADAAYSAGMTLFSKQTRI